MDLEETDESTPKKLIYDSSGENSSIKSLKSLNNYDSPFSVLPRYSTPPSRFLKIKNPFEASLIERLHLPVFSPSVFNKTTPPRSAEKFKWTIDGISTLTPADIDESSIHQVESPAVDPELESSAQERIDRYFSEKHIVPSPMMMGTHLISTTPPRRDKRLLKSCFHNESQTELSLPPELPNEVEEVLKPYFSYKEEETDKILFKHLFESHEPSYVSSSVESSPAQPCNLSPVQFSPCQREAMRNFGSPRDEERDLNNRDILSECNLSPINEEETWRDSKSVARLDFSECMSIDTSIGCVPNSYDVLPNNSLMLTTTSEMRSPAHELPSNSETVWDVEFNTVSIKVLDSPIYAVHEREKSLGIPMDISNANTPKSKKFSGVQRPKVLSNSFLFDKGTQDGDTNKHIDKENWEPANNDDDDDGFLDGVEVIEQRKKTFKSNFFRNLEDGNLEDDTDYDEDSNEAITGSSSNSWFRRNLQDLEDEEHSHHHLIASTPTKNMY